MDLIYRNNKANSDKTVYVKRRLELGLTQEEVARRVGCGVNSIRNWEMGKKQPIEFFKKCLEEVLGIEVEKVKRCYIFDIDGTLADDTHRVHYIYECPKNWDAYHAECSKDKPIVHMIELAQILNREAPIILISGRRESCRAETMDWLEYHGVRYEHLLLRPDGDYTNDDILKINLLSGLRGLWQPIMAFDNRTRVVKAWRTAGVPCCQVAEGDF